MRFRLEGRVPSWKNSSRVIRAGGKVRVVKSKQAAQWLPVAVAQIRSQTRENARGEAHGIFSSRALSLGLTLAYRGKRHPDLDNAIGSICDLLQLAGVIQNDRDILSINAELRREAGGDWAEITILPQKPIS